MNGRIETFEEFSEVLEKKDFRSFSPRGFSGLVWGVLERLRKNGVSSGKLDALLVSFGIKRPGNFARYVEYGKKLNSDMFALERAIGLDPDSWHPSGVPGLQAAERTALPGRHETARRPKNEIRVAAKQRESETDSAERHSAGGEIPYGGRHDAANMDNAGSGVFGGGTVGRSTPESREEGTGERTNFKIGECLAGEMPESGYGENGASERPKFKLKRAQKASELERMKNEQRLSDGSGDASRAHDDTHERKQSALERLRSGGIARDSRARGGE